MPTMSRRDRSGMAHLYTGRRRRAMRKRAGKPRSPGPVHVLFGTVIAIRRDCSYRSGAFPRVNRCQALERNVRPYADYRLVADGPRRVQRILDAAAGVDHVLKIRLQLPPRRDLVLVGELDEVFRAAHRNRSAEGRVIAVESAGAVADMGQTIADAEGVVVAPWQRRLQVDAGVEAQIDLVAIGRRAHQAGKDADRARSAGLAPHHLVDDAIEAEIALIGPCDTGARRAGKR